MNNVDILISQLEENAEKNNFSGVISLFEKNKTIMNKAFGYRDISNRIPISTDTKMGIASGTKLFTALGIGKLIEQNKVSLNTKISTIRREYINFIDPDATIRHLLNHTSGVYDYYDEELIEDFDNFFLDIPWYNLINPTDYFPFFKDQKMKFKAGERFSYSNGGYVLLGMIIEYISGRTYRDFINEHVLKPGEMRNTGFYAMNQLPENTAYGYHEDRITTNIFNLPIRGGGDGGMFTTTEDLYHFWKSLFSNRILQSGLLNEYLKTNNQFNEVNGYGLGIYKRLDDSLYAIVGSDAGVGFDSRYYPSKEITINILSNITDGERPMRKTVLDFMDRNL